MRMSSFWCLLVMCGTQKPFISSLFFYQGRFGLYPSYFLGYSNTGTDLQPHFNSVMGSNSSCGSADDFSASMLI